MKSIETIYQEMLDAFGRRSGYRPGDTCDLAVRLYAMAAQVHALLVQAEWVTKQSFPQSAAGEYLDYHAQTRGLQRGEAAAAEGVIRFYAPQSAAAELPIPAGTVCLTGAGVRFETIADAAIPAGETQTDVPARAMERGSAGNVSAHTVTLMAVAPAGVAMCDNPFAFTDGADGEDDESLRQRILESFRRLPNGANAAFYEQEAMSFPDVAAAKAVGRARGIGTVDVYVSAIGGVPDEALLTKVADHLQEKREIAVDVQVLAPALRQVEITAAITPAAGYTYAEAAAEAEQTLRNLFTGALLGKGVKLAELGDLLYHLKSVDNYALTAPAADIVGEEGVLPVLGSITLEEA